MPETAFSFSHLESPAPGAALPPGPHLFRGWVWPKPGGHFVDDRARVDGRVFAGIHGRPRADLAAHFKTGRRPALAEFSVLVEMPPGKIEVILEVLEIEGRWTPFQAATFQVAARTTPVTVPPPPRPLRWHEIGRAHV